MITLLMRHGQSEANREGYFHESGDTGLTDLGRQQARSIGQALQGYRIDAVLSASARRTQETAQILSEYLNLIPSTPIWLGDTTSHDSVLHKPMESASQTRALQVLDDLMSQYSETAIVIIVAHGTTCGNLLRAFLNCFDIIVDMDNGALHGFLRTRRGERRLLFVNRTPDPKGGLL